MNPELLEMLKEMEARVKQATHDLGNVLQVLVYLIGKGGRK